MSINVVDYRRRQEDGGEWVSEKLSDRRNALCEHWTEILSETWGLRLQSFFFCLAMTSHTDSNVIVSINAHCTRLESVMKKIMPGDESLLHHALWKPFQPKFSRFPIFHQKFTTFCPFIFWPEPLGQACVFLSKYYPQFITFYTIYDCGKQLASFDVILVIFAEIRERLISVNCPR